MPASTLCRMWLGPVAILAAAVAWMVVCSVYFARCANRLASIREAWLSRFAGDEAEQARRHQALVERTAEVGRLLRGAGVPDGQIPFAQPVGWGQIATGTASLFENWLVITQDVPTAMDRAFGWAIGVYRDRQRHALNPLWWIGLVFTAPQHLMRWLGGTGEGTATKVVTLAWAALVAASVFLGIAASLKALLGP